MLPLSLPGPSSIVRSPRGWSYLVGRSLGGGEFAAVFDCVGPFDQSFALKVFQPGSRPYQEVRADWLSEASASIHWNRGPETLECPHQTLRKAGNFDALAPTGASKFPSLPWIRATCRLYRLRHPNIVYVHEIHEQRPCKRPQML
jgi:hypothetical protein